MKKTVLTIMAVLAIAALSTMSFAYGRGHDMQAGSRGPGYGNCQSGDFKGLAALKLTAEQEAKIKSLRESQWKEAKPLQEKMFSKRGELKSLWLQQNPDQEKIIAVQKEIRDLRDQLQDKQTNCRLAVLKVLTPEQQAKLNAFGPGKGAGKGKGKGKGACPGCEGCGGYCPGMRGN